MSVTRRDFLRAATILAGTTAFGPIVGRGGWAVGEANALDVATVKQRRRLVLVELCGGNDGLNTVVPTDGQWQRDYASVRSRIFVDPAKARLHAIADSRYGAQGLHPSLSTLHRLYTEGRVAIVQGVGYADNNMSHFVSGDMWQSADPENTPQTGWLGRHLDRTGVAEGELRGVAIGSGLPLLLTGGFERGSQLLSLPPVFPGAALPGATAVRRGYAGWGDHPTTEPLRHYYGSVCSGVDEFVASTGSLGVPDGVGGLTERMLGARELLCADQLGVEIVSLKLGGFDTHSGQVDAHATLLKQLDQSIEAFLFGTVGGVKLYRNGQWIGALRTDIAERTIVMTWSEFGRRVGQNGTGTDHGAAAPMFLVGPQTAGAGVPVLKGGLHGTFPDFYDGGSVVKDLKATTDPRAVYSAIRGTWLSQPTDADAVRDHGDVGALAYTALSSLFA